MPHNKQKKIAVINDFCGFGRCSITVSLPIISAMGIQCCPVPTSVFSNHTAYDSFYFTDFTDHMEEYIEQWKKLGLTFSGILTGYLGSPHQIDIVTAFLEHFRKAGTTTVVDPVMGDGGKLYHSYSPLLAERMSHLIKYADILTPNLTEATILTGTEYRPDMSDAELENICRKLAAEGPEKIVISGLERGDQLVNFVYEQGKKTITVGRHKVGVCRSGTGDVFSSIIAADAVNGKEFLKSVEHAADFIAKAMVRTTELDLPRPDGICFEEFLKEL